MDPVFAWIARLALAGVFMVAAIHKLQGPRAFADVVRGYALIPDALAPIAVPVVIAIEGLLAFGLALGLEPGVFATAALALLAGYSGAIGLNLARGRRDIDCGCLGPARRQRLSGGLLGRNALLAMLALVTALPQTTRSLGWLDVFSVGAGLTTFALVFYAANLLLARPFEPGLADARDESLQGVGGLQ